MAAITPANAVNQRGATKSPILALLAVNITNGTIANGN